MKNMNMAETLFIRDIKPYLKEGVNIQFILDKLRVVESTAIKSDKNSFKKDVDWTDDELYNTRNRI